MTIKIECVLLSQCRDLGQPNISAVLVLGGCDLGAFTAAAASVAKDQGKRNFWARLRALPFYFSATFLALIEVARA